VFRLCSGCLGGELPPLSVLYVKQNFFFFCRARKGLGAGLALQCFAGLVSGGFLCEITRGVTTGDRGELFVLFISLFDLFLFNKIVRSL